MTDDFQTLSTTALASTHGGMRLDGACLSYNVEDRRPGAPRRDQQIRDTDRMNRANGCATWSDLNPGKRIPTHWGR